jgi:hypothetical protein
MLRLIIHRNKTSFHAGIETCSTSASQVAVLYHFLHFLWCHASQGFANSTIPARHFIFMQIEWRTAGMNVLC